MKIDELNSLTCVSLSDLQLCIAMGDNKAAMNSLSRRKNQHFVFVQDLSLLADDSNLICFAQSISFDLLVDPQRITEFNSSRIEFGDHSLVSQVKSQITLQPW